MSRADLTNWMRARQARIESVLDNLLPPVAIEPARLHEAMRYAVLGGGKRVRPLLAYAAGEAADAPIERVDHAAAAVELIHAYSLVHDDLPCMDDDVLRRGRPTVHVQFDEATALLVGDSLQSLAFEVLERPLCDDPAAQLAAIGLLARAAGSRGMAGGQAVDLASEGKKLSLQELEFMHIHKTGALIRAAASLGAACGVLGSDGRDAIARFSRFVGLAFQVVDDVLDATATTEALGKTAGKDAADDKPTYASVLGVERARSFVDELLEDALAALSPLGARGERLAALGRYLAERSA